MPPKKGNKMSLNDFLADEATGSWADDVDDLPISSQPRYPGDSTRRGDGYLASMPDRADRPLATPYAGAGAGASFDRSAAGPPRQDVPLPDKPPFTAFLGSLSFDVSEGDVADFFAPHNTVSVRIVTDRDGRPKGFGYVEFETLDALKDALAKSGASLAGRPVRVGVAEPPKSTSDRPGFAPSAAEEASQWRRAGPLPPSSNDGPSSRPGMGGRERSNQRGFGGPESSGPSGFDNMEVGAGGRSGFGTRHQASPAGGAGRDGLSPRGPPREPREPLEPSKGEVASDWRTGKPVEARSSRPGGFRSSVGAGEGQEEGAGGASGSGRSPMFRNNNSNATDVDEKYSGLERMGFGSKHVATPPESPSTQRGGPGRGSFERRGSGTGAGAGAAGDSADNWRSARGGNKHQPGTTSPLSGNAQASGAAAAAPALERKKLDLKPRSTSNNSTTTPASESSSSSSKASPFGNARPVDQASRQKAIEERLEKERQERAAAEAARKAEKEKAVKDAPTGPRADREKQSTSAATPKDESSSSSTTTTTSTPTTASTPAAKATPPTGAWGGGRVASGALAAKQQQEREAKEAAEKQKTNGSGSVDEVTSGVEKAAIASNAE